MKRYKISGLDCADCANKMEMKIQKLNHGKTAQLHFTTGTLEVEEAVDLNQVKTILKEENVILTDPTSESAPNPKKDSHEETFQALKEVIIAVIIFIAGLVVDSQVSITWFPLAFYLVATIIAGRETFISGLKKLFHLEFDIDTLMTIALIGAFLIGEYKEGTVVAILFGVNEWLEGVGMVQAQKAMDALLNVQPKMALRVSDGQEETVPVEKLALNDVVKVKAGEQIPSDGIILSGASSVNESAITGESMPIDKVQSDMVFGGSINNDGTLLVKLTKAYQDSTLAKILQLVIEAQETKTPTELFINKFARYYTPIIMLISVMVILIPPLFFGGAWSHWLYEGLAVLIIGCPCALVLSSPIALVAGITKSAKMGVLVKGGQALEQLGGIKQIAFDKTGTLTKGELAVAGFKTYDSDFETILYAFEKESGHPIAKAIVSQIEQQSTEIKTVVVDDVTTIPGRGLVGMVEDKNYYLGNEEQMPKNILSNEQQEAINKLKMSGSTLVLLADGEHLLGFYALKDSLRTESKQIMADLHHVGVKETVMLTGDHQAVAELIGHEVGIDHIYGGLLPEEKLGKVKKLTEKMPTAMVGDGINDSPALATATLGIAMGKGTDAAIEVADVVLMQDNLSRLPEVMSLAKTVRKTIGFNLILALSLKIFALALTIPGLLTLWIAVLADMGATVIVTLISLRLLLIKPKLK